MNMAEKQRETVKRPKPLTPPISHTHTHTHKKKEKRREQNKKKRKQDINKTTRMVFKILL